MSEERKTRPPRKKPSSSPVGEIPDPLRRRLSAWIDVEQVGVDGLWRWLEAILPLLPPPGTGDGAPPPTAGPDDRVRQLARALVDCAGDRARLTVSCERYYSDNQVLARRVKALEATLKTVARRGSAVGPSDDPESTEVSERYLPPG